MNISIHQPHYFPWIGYLDKMAKSDIFVILDQVQLEKGSQMIRNCVLDANGAKKYITISADTKDYLAREYRSIQTKDIAGWTTRQLNALKNYYRKAKYQKEIMPILEHFFQGNHDTVCQWVCASIELARKILDIKTPLNYQSQIEYDRENKRSDLVYAICEALKADVYFSGRGASVSYLERDKFAANHIDIVFQDFQHPVYSQCGRATFIPGVSVIDMLFNCGIEESKRIFWKNVHNTHEFEEKK